MSYRVFKACAPAALLFLAASCSRDADVVLSLFPQPPTVLVAESEIDLEAYDILLPGR